MGDGVTQQVARATVQKMLPSDARLTELYVAPPTTSGPIALVTERYESRALAENPALAPDVLVIHQEIWGEPTVADSTAVHTISMAIRERTQATG